MHMKHTVEGFKLLYAADTGHSRLEVREGYFRGHVSRLLLEDGALETAMPLSEGEEHVLLFPYMRLFDQAFALRPGIRSVLLIGGGGFQWPRHVLKTRPDIEIDVVESSPDVISISRRFFGLNTLEKDARFHLYPADGFDFLLGSAKRYDLILNDAFTGAAADSALLSAEGISLTKVHLSEEGLSLLNMVSAVRGPFTFRTRHIRRRFSDTFRHTLLLQADESRSPYDIQNCVLFASGRPLTPDEGTP